MIKGNNRRKHLFKTFQGKCYYCGCDCDIVYIPRPHKKYPFDLATIEHLYSKYNILRYLSKKTVLSCWKCNNDKCAIDTEMVEYPYKRFKKEAKTLTLQKLLEEKIRLIQI